MAQQPIYNPPIPYLGPIPGGCQPGQMITIDGFIPHHSQRFAINLQCGPGVNPRDDIAFHINLRFPEMCVVRNNLQSMSWGPEETHGGIPLSPGQNFQAIILCEQQSFKLALNGSHFCEFTHRIPFYRVSHITIDGDVTVSMIQFQGQNQGFQQNSWNSPQMGMPTAPMMENPPPYGPPPPYSQQPVYSTPSPAYNMPYGGGFQAPPVMGGYQSTPYFGSSQSQPPFGNQYQSSQVPSFNYNTTANPPLKISEPPKNNSSFGKKALMYGLPLAGVGLGAYALGGGFSRSSSSSDDDWLG